MSQLLSRHIYSKPLNFSSPKHDDSDKENSSMRPYLSIVNIKLVQGDVEPIDGVTTSACKVGVSPYDVLGNNNSLQASYMVDVNDQCKSIHDNVNEVVNGGDKSDSKSSGPFTYHKIKYYNAMSINLDEIHFHYVNNTNNNRGWQASSQVKTAELNNIVCSL